MAASTTLPVSAVIITRNEERTIARCLASVAWADQVLVIDAESTDRTPEICKDPGASWAQKLTFESRPWKGFNTQRNLALALARNDWVLVIDSDEACSPALAAKLKSLLETPQGPPMRAYKVRRQEYFLGKPIHHGIWNPSYQDRFFDRRGIQYVNEVHEYPVFPSQPGVIQEPIEHDPTFNLDRFLHKMNLYTTIEAQDRYNQGMRTNAARMLLAFPAMFLKNYFYYESYKDGFHGFAISILEGISRAVRHLKLWRLEHVSSLQFPSQDRT